MLQFIFYKNSLSKILIWKCFPTSMNRVVFFKQIFFKNFMFFRKLSFKKLSDLNSLKVLQTYTRNEKFRISVSRASISLIKISYFNFAEDEGEIDFSENQPQLQPRSSGNCLWNYSENLDREYPLPPSANRVKLSFIKLASWSLSRRVFKSAVQKEFPYKLPNPDSAGETVANSGWMRC